MPKLTQDDLFTLEHYAKIRNDFRDKVMAHKKSRQVPVGDHATLYFEDSLTIQYQVQEMLRIEKIFEQDGILEELEAYNPLIPDGNNWKAVFMLEYEDVEERKVALENLLGIEDRVWVQIAEMERAYAIADEDMDRERENKTSAVHFLRFQLSDEMVAAAKSGMNIAMGIDHPNYNHVVDGLAPDVARSLAGDLN